MSRSDGSATYNLAAVVDDHDFEITDVIRGDDHLTNAVDKNLFILHLIGKFQDFHIYHLYMVLMEKNYQKDMVLLVLIHILLKVLNLLL